MKACILTTSFPAYEGHIQSPFIAELAKAMSKHAEVTVICPNYKVSKAKEENFGKVKVKRFSYFPKKFQTLTEGGGLANNLEKNLSSYLQMPFFIFSMFLRLVKEIKSVDVIFAQWALAGLVAVAVSTVYKKPVILTTRGADVNMAIKNYLYKKILTLVLSKCKFITSNNEDLINKINSLGIKKTTVIRNGVDTEKFCPRNKKELRKKFGLPTDKKIILFVGWLIPRKGVNYLINAIPDVVKENKDVLFLILGEGPMRNELELLISELNIGLFVRFVGSKKPEEVPYWLSASDILVLPSLAEGMPNVVLEAMASEVPVVATRVSGTPELVKDGVNGYLIAPESSEEIADKLNKILAKPKAMKELGKNGRASLIEKGLTWDTSAKKYLELVKVI